jgi:hypothetical protein
MEPIATTVAGLEPDTAANSAQASTPPRPRPPYQWPDHRGGEADHPFGHPAVGQEVAGQDEEGDRHDLELLDAGEQFQGHRFDGHLRHGEQEGQDRQAQRDADRHAGQHQDQQQAEDDGGAHAQRPLGWRLSSMR